MASFSSPGKLILYINEENNAAFTSLSDAASPISDKRWARSIGCAKCWIAEPRDRREEYRRGELLSLAAERAGVTWGIPGPHGGDGRTFARVRPPSLS